MVVPIDQLDFRKGLRPKKGPGESLNFAEVSVLPEAEREQLCRTLLSEFGVTKVQATRRGELIHSCSLPDHNDRNPSAQLNYEKLTYSCFSCGRSGGLLWYIATCRGEDTDDARRWLKDQTGVGNTEQSLGALLDFFDAVYGEGGMRPPPMPKHSPTILEPWMRIHPYLTDPIAEGGRGIPEANIERFTVGFGTMRIAVGDSYVSSDRIIIPHFWKGDLVGWQSRRLWKDGSPKYHSTPDLPKDRTIYNYEETSEPVVVVESPMSVLSKAHLFPVQATFGAMVTDRQVRLLARHPRLVLFMDNDEAGWMATEHLIEALADYSIVAVAPNDWAADPADMDHDTYAALVSDAIPASLWSRPTSVRKWVA